jgi:hypothetical protein
MLNLVLALLLFQTVPPGVVTGTVRGADGAPAAGVRVYAVPLRDAADVAVTGATVFESLAQTDVAGRYRLEVPPGRYYIASGSVQTPTYYPGTAEASAARPVTIASGTQVSGIDFSSFVAPAPIGSLVTVTLGGLIYRVGPGGTLLPPPPPPVPSAVLFGVITGPDRNVAAGLEVLAVPEKAITANFTPALMNDVHRTHTDSFGRYQFANVYFGNYYIVAGFADRPVLYPGTPDVALATSVKVNSTASIGPLNFSMPGFSISGRVVVSGGLPGTGMEVRLQRTSPPPASPVGGPGAFLPHWFVRQIAIDQPDGSFSLSPLPSGQYLVEAFGSAALLPARSINIADQSASGIDFSFPVATISGSVRLDNGQRVSSPNALGAVAFRRTAEGDDSSSTLLRVSDTGTFSSLFEPGTYEIGFPALPSEYEVRSVTAGGVDLLKEKLRVTTEPVRVEIRLRTLSQ